MYLDVITHGLATGQAMCIIQGEVDDVSNTRIIAAVFPNGQRQLIVYCNEVDSVGGQRVAMILPFPNPHGGDRDVHVIKTTESDMDHFDSLYNAFKLITLNYRSANVVADGFDNDCETNLKVYRAGSYQYSIAPTAADISRADPQVFSEIPGDLSNLLGEYSIQNYGFIVCIIDHGAAYTPFAYTCRTMNGEMFIPTKHYHSHSDGQSGLAHADWDHTIYVLGNKKARVCESLGNLSGSTPNGKLLPLVFGKHTKLGNILHTIVSGLPSTANGAFGYGGLTSEGAYKYTIKGGSFRNVDITFKIETFGESSSNHDVQPYEEDASHVEPFTPTPSAPQKWGWGGAGQSSGYRWW